MQLPLRLPSCTSFQTGTEMSTNYLVATVLHPQLLSPRLDKIMRSMWSKCVMEAAHSCIVWTDLKFATHSKANAYNTLEALGD